MKLISRSPFRCLERALNPDAHCAHARCLQLARDTAPKKPNCCAIVAEDDALAYLMLEDALANHSDFVVPVEMGRPVLVWLQHRECVLFEDLVDRAAAQNQICVLDLLANGIYRDDDDELGNALHAAAYYGMTRALRALRRWLFHTYGPNAAHIERALDGAVEGGHIAAMRLLRAMGARGFAEILDGAWRGMDPDCERLLREWNDKEIAIKYPDGVTPERLEAKLAQIRELLQPRLADEVRENVARDRLIRAAPERDRDPAKSLERLARERVDLALRLDLIR